MFQSPGPVAFEINSVQVHWYGIIIAAGIALAYLYVTLELRRHKLASEPVDAMALWVIISGVIGARLYYVLFNLDFYSAHPEQILQIWNGGLAIHGALLGGAAAFFIFIFRRKLSWALYADILMPGILLAQALGRWGNFFNNEAFGVPTSLPWKLYIPARFRPEQFENFSYFHPTFLYESLWNLVGFAILALLARYLYKTITTDGGLQTTDGGLQTTDYRRWTTDYPSGIIFSGYLIWYSFGRFFIEGLRTDSLYLGSFRIAQIVSALLFIGAAIYLLFLLRKSKLKKAQKADA